jgi:hypothetical protein
VRILIVVLIVANCRCLVGETHLMLHNDDVITGNICFLTPTGKAMVPKAGQVLQSMINCDQATLVCRRCEVVLGHSSGLSRKSSV